MKISEFWNWLLHPPVDGPRATFMPRLMAGGVFLWEGIMKFVYPNLGVGRFTKLGFPAPGVLATFVAWVEIIGGILFIVGWLTRPVAIAFIIEMIVAMLSTKIGVYYGTSPLGLPAAMPKIGLGAVLHDIRSDYAQIMTSLFLLLAGPGPLSLDARTVSVRRSRPAMAFALVLMLVGISRASKSGPLGSPLADPVAPDAFLQGKQAVERKDYKAATQFFGTARQQHPDNPDVLNMLAFSERKQGNLEEAFEYYHKALALRPRFPEAREYLAEAHLQAAMQEFQTLKGYGPEGQEEAGELAKEFKEAAEKL